MKYIFAAMVTLFLLLAGQGIGQETVKQKTINVTGMAEMEVVPDEIFVQINLREYDKKGGGKVDIDEIRKDFLKSAVEIGLHDSDLSVQSYQGWDGNLLIYKKNKKKNPDLKASIVYEVKLATTKKMDELVQKLDDEATQDFFISRVSHSKIQEFKRQLRILAVKSARDKANYLAEAINEKSGEAIMINEPNEINAYPPPVFANRLMKAAINENGENAQTPNIDFKKIKLQFEVSATFALK